MQAPDLIRLFVVPLNALDVPYMVTGAVASAVYGEPRFTRDLDLVLALRPSDAGRFAGAFSADAYYVPPREVIAEEASRARHGHFNVIHHETALKADCYLAAGDPLHGWALERRVRVDVGRVPVWLAPIEYVIVRKLQWHGEGGADRHLEDIRGMLRVSGDAVDRGALDAWTDRLGLSASWGQVAEGEPHNPSP
jgi:hypothetical protein